MSQMVLAMMEYMSSVGYVLIACNGGSLGPFRETQLSFYLSDNPKSYSYLIIDFRRMGFIEINGKNLYGI